MKVDVLNMQGEKVKQVELPAAIFEAKVNPDLMHQAFQRQMANARLGTHQTKVRGEVAGGGTQALEAEGHRPRPPGLHHLGAVGRRRPHSHAPSAQVHAGHAAQDAAGRLRSALSAKAARVRDRGRG